MRHLFFIHSQITFIVSIKIIKYLKLDHKDCVFIIHRGKSSDYKSFGVKMADFPFNPHSLDSFPVFNKFWKSWINIKELDKFINKIAEKQDFIFYTPQTYQKYLALIVSNNKCKGYNIIEEGSGAYLTQRQLNNVFTKAKNSLFVKILWKLNFLSRLKISRSFMEDGFTNVFVLTPYSFVGVDRKVILGLPSLDDYKFEEPNEEADEYKNILVFDALVEANILDSGTFLLSTLILLNKLIENGESNLHVKFHPDQLKAGKTLILLRELFRQTGNLKIIEIPQRVSLEEVALKQEANFYVFASAIGIYASLYGKKVYSLCKVIERLNPAFSKKIENMPLIFKEKVKFI